jgi:hypothetical protein
VRTKRAVDIYSSPAARKVRSRRAGTPTYTPSGSVSCVTAAPAPIVHPRSIVTPASTTTRAPNQLPYVDVAKTDSACTTLRGADSVRHRGEYHALPLIDVVTDPDRSGTRIEATSPISEDVITERYPSAAKLHALVKQRSPPDIKAEHTQDRTPQPIRHPRRSPD